MQQQISGGAPPPSSLQVTSMVVTWIISLIALLVAMYSLYLQRKDKKPRLRITLDMNFNSGVLGEVTDITIQAGNPTDKQINIDSVKFAAEGYGPIDVPLSQTIEGIPPHEKRSAIVVVPQFRTTLGVANAGYFVLTDALGYRHISRSIKV